MNERRINQMKSDKLKILSIVLFIIISVVTFTFYGELPERVPTHWTMGGIPDRFAARPFAAFSLLIMIALILALWILLSRKLTYKIRNYYNVFFFILILVLIFVQALSLLWDLGHKFDISLYGRGIGGIAIGILFIWLGVFLKTAEGKIHAGIHFGPRVVSTKALSDTEVRKKTNDITGSLFMVLGLVLIVLNFFPKLYNLGFSVALCGCICITVFVYVYSSFIYEHKNK